MKKDSLDGNPSGTQSINAHTLKYNIIIAEILYLCTLNLLLTHSKLLQYNYVNEIILYEIESFKQCCNGIEIIGILCHTG